MLEYMGIAQKFPDGYKNTYDFLLEDGYGKPANEFVHVNLGKTDEEYVQVLAADQDAQTFTAVFTKSHLTGATVRPTIWPTPISQRGRQPSVRYPGGRRSGPRGDLTVVIQT